MNFKRLRRERGWTQAECAEKGGVTPAYISQVESSRTKSFGSEAEKKWAVIFGVDWLEFYRAEVPDEFLEAISAYTSKLSPEDKRVMLSTIRGLADGMRTRHDLNLQEGADGSNKEDETKGEPGHGQVPARKKTTTKKEKVSRR